MKLTAYTRPLRPDPFANPALTVEVVATWNDGVKAFLPFRNRAEANRWIDDRTAAG